MSNIVPYEIVTQQILEALERGVVPWRGAGFRAMHTGADCNLVSKKAYRGINVLLTACAGYSSPWWVTYKQALEMGGNVRKGEKSTTLTFWKLLKFKDAAEPDGVKKIPMLRYYRVFNVDQCDGLTIPETDQKPAAFNPIYEAENIVSGMPERPDIVHKGAQPCYVPGRDVVEMPVRESWDSAEFYYHVLFHELTHSTGHASRLGRDMTGGRYSAKYAKEELIAEIGAEFLARAAGIDCQLECTAAYIDGWRRAISDDIKLVVQAAGAAQRAADYILNVQYDDNDGQEETATPEPVAKPETTAKPEPVPAGQLALF